MGNDVSTAKKSEDLEPVVVSTAPKNIPTEDRPLSNLSVLMNQHQHQEASAHIPIKLPSERSLHDEADSASGPPARNLVSSAPNLFSPSGVHDLRDSAASAARVASTSLTRRFSSGIAAGFCTPPTGVPVNLDVDAVRR
jgi:hypothetical protein